MPRQSSKPQFDQSELRLVRPTMSSARSDFLIGLEKARMLRVAFIGDRWDFTEILVHWLSQRSELVGVVWTQQGDWRNSWYGRIKFAKRRLRRYGFAKVFNETLFFLFYRSFLMKHDESEVMQKIIKPYMAQHKFQHWQGDAISVKSVNASEALAFLKSRKLDVVFAMCINEYFREELRSIPRMGVYLWHEGITPAYRGLYSPFWAVYNLDFDHIGYTLLKMNNEYDAGEIFVQGQARDIDPLQHIHGFIGHKAIMDSLPAVEKFLVDLERGEAISLRSSDNATGYYTYPGFSHFVRQRFRLRRHSR